MASTANNQPAGKITRDPEAVAIDAINRAMASLDDDSKAAVVAWFQRRFAKTTAPATGS